MSVGQCVIMYMGGYGCRWGSASLCVWEAMCVVRAVRHYVYGRLCVSVGQCVIMCMGGSVCRWGSASLCVWEALCVGGAVRHYVYGRLCVSVDNVFNDAVIDPCAVRSQVLWTINMNNNIDFYFCVSGYMFVCFLINCVNI